MPDTVAPCGAPGANTVLEDDSDRTDGLGLRAFAQAGPRLAPFWASAWAGGQALARYVLDTRWWPTAGCWTWLPSRRDRRGSRSPRRRMS